MIACADQGSSAYMTPCSARIAISDRTPTPIVLNLVETPTSTPQLTSGGPGGNALISTGVEVADNTFAVPGANGCGLLGALDVALDLKVGLPSASGKNSALIDQNGESSTAQFLLPATPTADSNADRHSDADRNSDSDTERDGD